MPRRRRLFRRLSPRARRAVAVAFFVLAIAGTVAIVLEGRHLRIETRLRDWAPSIARHSHENHLPPELVTSIVRAESGGDASAVSSAGAVGLMQITPITLREVQHQRGYAGGDLYDGEYNLKIGTAYLRQLLDRFGGDTYLAVAAYNMGPSRLAAIRDEHPNLDSRQLVQQYAPDETVTYCKRVLGE